jgi:colanic acid biosynthesis glycosyl transferase WcaI
VRFLILTQYFAPEPGAAQVRLAALAEQLVRAGHEVEIVTAMPNYPSGRILERYRHSYYRSELWKSILIHRVWLYPSQGVGFGRMINYGSFVLSCLIGLAKSRKPDYLFVESPPLFLSLPGFIAARFWGVPWIFNVADLWPDSVAEMQLLHSGWLLRAASVLEKWTYRHATYVSAVTWAIRQQLLTEKCVPQEKLLFLPNGIDAELFRPLPPDQGLLRRLGLEDKQVVIFPGTHGYAHSVESILQAAERLRHDENIHFLLIGSGSAKPQLMCAAQKLGLRNMTFLDPVPPEQIPQFISIACCGLVSMRDIPLLQDARPVKALAIMGCGKPVILAVGRGSGSFVKQAQAGLVVPVDEPDAIAEAIRYLADHPEEAARLGCNGRSYVCQNLQWSGLVDEWLGQLHGAAQSA